MIKQGILQNWIKQKKWLLLEIIVVAAFFTFFWLWLAAKAGGPIFNDELLYMETALDRAKEGILLFRYFHVYLMVPFFDIAGDPFIGVKYFWAFVVSLTAVLVYLNSRLLSGWKVLGVLSTLLFVSQVQIFHYPGVVWTDFTAMMLIMLGVLFYILLQKKSDHLQVLLVGLGLVLYLIIRTKEVGVILWMLLLGLGWLRQESYDWKAIFTHLKWVFAGVLSGIALMLILDWIILQDPFYSFRLQNMKQHAAFFLMSGNVQEYYNYILLLTRSLDTLSVFVLYLLSLVFVSRRADGSNYIKLLYLLPVGYFMFMLASLLRGPGVMEARYLIAVLPVMCVLGVQFIDIDSKSKSAWNNKLFFLIVYFGLVVIGYFSSDWFIMVSQRFGITKWEQGNYFYTLVYPAVFFVLFMSVLYIKKHTMLSAVIPFLCVSFMVYSPLLYNLDLLESGWARENSERRFYPFTEFVDEIKYSADMKMFISDNLPENDPSRPSLGMLDEWSDVLSAMFDLIYRVDSRDEQFNRLDFEEYNSTYDQYNYAIITSQDWGDMNEDLRENVRNACEVYSDADDLIRLLDCNW